MTALHYVLLAAGFYNTLMAIAVRVNGESQFGGFVLFKAIPGVLGFFLLMYGLQPLWTVMN